MWLNDGSETWILIHIEIQGYHDTDFENRMFTYYYRIYERYKKEVVSFAILCDGDPQYRPNQYHKSRWGCELQFKFPTIKLLDQGKNWEQLKQNNNVFAVIVMAHLKALKVQVPEQQKDLKINLVRLLYRRSYDRAIIVSLFQFIDWIIRLPKALEDDFLRELQSYDEERSMLYITRIERNGIEKGELKKARENIIEALEINLDISVPAAVVKLVNQESDNAKLSEMLRKAIKVKLLKDFLSWINK